MSHAGLGAGWLTWKSSSDGLTGRQDARPDAPGMRVRGLGLLFLLDADRGAGKTPRVGCIVASRLISLARATVHTFDGAYLPRVQSWRLASFFLRRPPRPGK